MYQWAIILYARRLLSQAISCLVTATSGCSALTDITYQQLQSMKVDQATAACNVTSFSAATTNGPVAILETTTTAAVSAAAKGEWIIIGSLMSFLLMLL